MQPLLGVDIGTTSTKVVLYDATGHVTASANHGYRLTQTEPGMAEENPAAIFKAVITGIQAVMPHAQQPIGGISFSAAMHSLILLDANHEPLTRMFTWADNRAKAAADQLRTQPQAQQLYQNTGTPLRPMTPLAKLIWLGQAQPAVMAKLRWAVDIKSYVIYRLTGELVMDYSIANATGLFNLNTFSWDPLALQLAHITTAQLPQLVDTTTQITGLQPQLAAELNLAVSTPLIVGASDGCLSNLGLNAIAPGVAALTIGTSGAVRVVTDQPQLDPHGRLFCYYLAPHRWVVGGPVNNGGNVLKWVRDTFYSQETQQLAQHHQNSYDLITKQAGQVPAGSHGLIMHPYLNGERAPLWNANARGAYFGLTAQHTRADLSRAALEGISFNLLQVAELVQQLTGPFQSLQATGGFANSVTWRQILADVLATPLVIPDSFESSCLGAAVLGWVSLGQLPDLTAVAGLVGHEQKVHPEPSAVNTYQRLYPIYQALTTAYQPLFSALADFN